MSSKKTPISSLKEENNFFATLINTELKDLKVGALNKITGRGINAKFIPLNQIKVDPTNPRKGPLSFEEIKNGPKIKDHPFEEHAQKELEEKLNLYFQDTDIFLKEKKITAYIDLALFAASIRKPEDLINPVTVYKEDNFYNLEAGHRRTYAHYILDAKEIAAVIKLPPESTLEKKILQYKENTGREGYTLAGEVDNIKQITEAYELSFKNQISVNKLVSLIPDLKRTKAAWLLGVMREMSLNNDYKHIIEQDFLSSLEAAYFIAQAKNELKEPLIKNALLKREKISLEEARSARKGENKSAVRTPNTKITSKPLLKIASHDSELIFNFVKRLIDAGIIENSQESAFNKEAFKNKRISEEIINKLILEIANT